MRRENALRREKAERDRRLRRVAPGQATVASPSPRLADTDGKYEGRLLVGLLFLLGAALAFHRLVSFDLWWQIATGDWIANFGIPHVDPFSYASGSRTWIEVRWLYCCLLSFLFHHGGLNALVLLQVVAALATLGLVALSARRASAEAIAAGLTVALLAMHPRFAVRPELASFAFLAGVLLLVERYRDSGRWQWLLPLPLLQVIWTNSHTLFVLGPVALLIYTLSEAVASYLPIAQRNGLALDRRRLVPLALATLATAGACWANPYGTRGALFPLDLLGEIRGAGSLASLSAELQSPFSFAGRTLLFWRFPIAVSVSLLAMARGWRRLRPGLVSLWLAFLYLATLADRNIALFGVVAAIVTVTSLASSEHSAARAGPALRVAVWLAIGVTALAVAAVETGRYWPRVDTSRRFGLGLAEHRFPLRPLTLLERVAPSSRLLTDWGDGSAALFLRGEKSVFADGRLEVYGKAVIERIDGIFRLGEGFDAIRDEYGIDSVLIRHSSDGVLLRRLLRRPDWTPIYFDATHVLFLRADAIAAERLAELRVDWDDPRRSHVDLPRNLEPTPWPARRADFVDVSEASGLAELALFVGNLGWARSELEIVVREWPRSHEARWKLGVVERALGNDARAAELLGPTATQIPDALTAARAFQGADSLEAALATFCLQVGRGGAEPEQVSRAIAELARQTGRIERGEKALSTLSETSPASVATWNAYGGLAVARGDMAAGAARFERALALDPRQPKILLALAEAREATGETSRALEAARAALRLEPTLTPARELVDRLEHRVEQRATVP